MIEAVVPKTKVLGAGRAQLLIMNSRNQELYSTRSEDFSFLEFYLCLYFSSRLVYLRRELTYLSYVFSANSSILK